MRRALCFCVVLALSGTVQAAAPPPQWLPQDSWPGGKQYDTRLEKTVEVWGTGVPAADPFASITKQAGIDVRGVGSILASRRQRGWCYSESSVSCKANGQHEIPQVRYGASWGRP